MAQEIINDPKANNSGTWETYSHPTLREEAPAQASRREKLEFENTILQAKICELRHEVAHLENVLLVDKTYACRGSGADPVRDSPTS